VLERIIEKAGEVDVTASAVVAAIQGVQQNQRGRPMDRPQRAIEPERSFLPHEHAGA
jgi:hypothetical protein